MMSKIATKLEYYADYFGLKLHLRKSTASWLLNEFKKIIIAFESEMNARNDLFLKEKLETLKKDPQIISSRLSTNT